jgi:hypothetical protein
VWSSIATVDRAARSRPRDRAAAAFLIGLMIVGSLVLWIGVPVGSSWVAARLTSDATAHLQITIPLTIAGMVLFGRLLFWVNKLYLRISDWDPIVDPEDEDPKAPRRVARGPLESIIVVSLVIAVVALTFWFFVLAENPSRLVI